MTFSAIPIGSILISDVKDLCTENTPEGESLEFKQNLSWKSSDAWATRSTISERARNGILKEVIAFANAHGGRLIIGVRETADSPPRAEAITPIDNCHDLAERLLLCARDVVSPQIPLLSARGIPSKDSTDGCVVIDVPESPLAPHRLEPTGQCYVRHADRSEKMTMREIQDLTIDRLRGSERLDARLKQLVDALHKPTVDKYYIQLAATPTTAKVSLPWNTELAAIVPVTARFSTRNSRITHELPNHGFSQPRPILRGWRWGDQWQEPQLVFDIFWDGSVVVQFEVRKKETNWVLFPEWVVALAGNALLEVEKVRTVAGQPDVEYAVKFQIQTSRALHIMRYGDNFPSTGHAGDLHETLSPPVYAVSSRNTFSGLVDDIQRDLFNAAGVTAKDIGIEI